MVRRILTTASVLAVLSWSAAGIADAQMRGDKAVYFTFSEPVVLPQVTLPAGKYLFRLADSTATRRVVQVYAADGSKLYGMMITLHAQRPEPPDEPEIRFMETPADTPPAVATYWYPGETTGWEFIYPREQAMKLAQTSKQSVLTTTEDATTEEMESAELSRVSPTGQETPVGDEPQVQTTVAGRPQAGEVATDAPTTFAESGEEGASGNGEDGANSAGASDDGAASGSSTTQPGESDAAEPAPSGSAR